MQKSRLLFSVIFLILLSAANLSASAAQTLTYATYTAPKGLRGHAEEAFINALKKVSHGSIKVIPYWGGSILQGDEILSGVKNGVANMGLVNINYYPNQLLLNSVFQMFPEGPEQYSKKMELYKKVYKEVPQLTKELKDSGQHVVYMYTVLPTAGVFRQPINNGIKGFKNRRVRAPSQWMLNMLRGLGATPVSVPWSDTYQALQAGTIDGVWTNFDSIHRIGLDKIAPHLYVTRKLWSAVPYLFTINNDKWNSFSQQTKHIFEKASKLAEHRFGKYYSKRFDQIVTTDKKSGISITRASDQDIKYYVSLPAVKKNRQQWLQQAKQKGATNPNKVLKQVAAIVHSYSK